MATQRNKPVGKRALAAPARKTRSIRGPGNRKPADEELTPVTPIRPLIPAMSAAAPPVTSMAAPILPVGATLSGGGSPSINPPGVRTMKRILMIDLSHRELQERAKLRMRRDRLAAVQRTEDSSGGLSREQEAELERITVALDSDQPVDDFFRTVVSTLRHKTWEQLVKSREYRLEHGLFGSQQMGTVQAGLGNQEQEIAFVCGLLELDNNIVPTVPSFIKKITEAQGEFRQHEALFDAAYETFSRVLYFLV